MTVLQVCAFGAEYPGNFIASLEALECELNKFGIITIYAFIERARDKYWCKEIQKRTTVYFLPEAKARILPKTYSIFKRIYKENDITVVHSHFELFDIPATVCAPKNTKVFWHLHDPLTEIKGLRGLLWKLQYGFFSKRAFLLSIAENYNEFAVRLGFKRENTAIILNAIQLNRIDTTRINEEKEFDFLTFGWDFSRKGGDLILQACEKLSSEGYKFKLLYNGNDITWSSINAFYEGALPEYLTLCSPSNNVNEFFAKSKVFIQASRRETFSYSVCEAAYFGLPVICSDIPGHAWAKSLPTVDYFESENVEFLYEHMKTFLEGKRFSSMYINNTRQIISDNFSVTSWAKKILDFYGFN